MRAVVQRVKSGRVRVEGRLVGEIEQGLVVLVGAKKGDGIQDAEYLIEKICNLRVFEDSAGKMNLSVQDVSGAVLVVSQFTLYGDARRGRRPSFSDAAPPDEGRALIDHVAKGIARRGIPVATGEFGSHMVVEIINDGPCTILLDSEKVF